MTLVAYLAFAAVLTSNVQYIRSIIRGETRPSLAAMLVFVVSLGSALASSYALKADWPVLLTIAINLVLNTTALVVVLCRGLGHTNFTAFEKAGLLAIVASNAAWYLSGDAWVALVAPTIVDAVGLWMVIRKLGRDPGSEDVFAWVMVAAAYALSLLSVPAYSAQNTLYAGVNLVLCGYIGGLSWRQRITAR